jgi:hypothetical protein
VLTYLEEFKKGITKEVLVLDLVNRLEEESEFLTNKIHEGITKYSIIFDKKGVRSKLKKLEQNNLLLGFMGLDNVKLIEETYRPRK